MIADLTYARPSVYYEAGYASGAGKPVIYLARKDHFRQHEHDPAGNLRVHFDLQMRNIIPWTQPDDGFRKRLKKRLNYVLRPIQNDIEESRKKKENEKCLAAIPLYDKLTTLTGGASALMYSLGYEKVKGISSVVDLQYNPAYAQFVKIVNRVYHSVHIISLETLNKKEAHYPLWLMRRSISTDQIISKGKSICFFASLKNLRMTTLASLFPSWTPISDKVFAHHGVEKSHDYNIPHSIFISVIDGIKSVEGFKEQFRSIIANFEADNEFINLK